MGWSSEYIARASHLGLRQPLVVLHERAVVLSLVTVGLKRDHHLEERRRQRDRRAHVSAGLHGVDEVLDVQPDAEARGEVPVEHHGRLRLHHGRTSKAAADRSEDGLRVDAGLLGEHQRLGQRADVDCHHNLVGKLGDVACADVADSND